MGDEDDGVERHLGESVDVGGGTIQTYATTDADGRVSSLGVHLDGDAVAAFDEGGGHRDQEVAAHPHFPDRTDAGVDLDHQFTYVGFHYNPEGHPPPDVYTVPHFDFHFYTMGHETVEGISGGPLPDEFPFVGLGDYAVPEAQHPPGFDFERHRFIVQEMGEHLLDVTAPEFQGEPFTHTYVYGIYDDAIDPASPDDTEVVELAGEEVEMPVYEGDGEGRVHFVEPMITTDYVSNDLDRTTRVGVATPARFADAGRYPTAYVMKPDGDGGVFVAVDGFQAFPGPGG